MRHLYALPKVHLHVHLEGTIRVSTLVEIAARHGAEPPACLRDGRLAIGGQTAFFQAYQEIRECLRDADDFGRIAYELCEDEAAQGVRYAEVTFTPAFHALRLGDWEMPLVAILEGFARGEAEFGIRCRLILDHSRRRPMELAEETLALAMRYRDAGVVALGLGGPEAEYPPEPFQRVFRAALDGGLHSVPHAGEGAGPASIRGALDALGAERLGHGVRVLEDAELVAEVRERRIPLEVCPNVNVLMGVFPSVEEHPLPRLLAEGLVVTLNSDVPSMIGTPLSAEYEAARRVHGLTDEALADIARMGVRAAFLDDSSKATLESEIDRWLDSSDEK